MTRADNYEVKMILDDGLDPVTETENPFAIPPAEGVQVAALGSNIKSIIKGYQSNKPVSKIKEDLYERRTPTSSEENAEDILTAPPGYEPGRPSAEDITQRNINFDNIESTDDVKTLLDTVSEQQDHSYNTTRRGTVSHEQTQMEAEVYAHENDMLAKLLGRKPGAAFNAAQITAARNLLVDSAEKLQKLAQKITEVGGNDLEILKFRQAVAKHSAIQAQVSGLTAEAGRALNAFKIPAQAGKVRMKQLKDIVESSGGSATAEKLAILIADAGDPYAISEVTRKFAYSTKTDMLLEYWINGLLSGLTTHAVNITGNALTAIWAVPERFLAASIRKLRRSPDGVQMGEVVAQAYGMVQGFNDGLKLGWIALKTGEPSDPMMKLEHHARNAITGKNVSNTMLGKTKAFGLSPAQVEAGGVVGKAVDFLGEGIRLPGRFLGAEDEFYKAIGYRMELHAQAYRQATLEGLEGDALAKRIQNLVEHPTEEIHLNADTMAQYQTFTKPLGKAGKKVQELASIAPVLRFVMPFIRTPVNILKYVGERTPVAWMSDSVRADILAGGAKSDIALARISLGSMLLISGGMLGWEEKVTGNLSGPVKKAYYRKGMMPNSIKVGDSWYSLNRLDPLGAFFTMSADIAQIIKYADSDTDITEATTAVAHAVSKGLLSKTYLRGVSEVLSAINSRDEEEMKRVLSRYPATFLPATSLLAGVERVMDPTLRETFGVLDAMRARIPTLSDDLPPRRNLWGDPIILEGGLGPDMISPIYTSTEKYSLADDEIINNDVNVRKPRKYIESGKRYQVELKPWEYDKLVYLFAKEIKVPSVNGKTLPLKQHMEAYMRTTEYKALTPMAKGNYIQGTILKFKGEAKRLLLESSPELRARRAASMNKKQLDLKGQKIPENILQQYINGGR